MISFEGVTADDVWVDAIKYFSQGYASEFKSRNGVTKEVLQASFTILKPESRWVFSRLPALNIAFALVEVIWIMSGRKDSKFINFFNKEYSKYAGARAEYHGAYGFRLREHFLFDQVEKAYKVLKANHGSRQVVLQIWDSRIDFPSEAGVPVSDDIPCNICSLLKVRDNMLYWTQVIRSNDMFLGVPYNFIQFTLMQEIIAGWLNLALGSYCQVSDSLHIYENNYDQIARISKKEIKYKSDNFMLSKKDFDTVLKKIENWVDLAISNEKVKHVSSALEKIKLPDSYQDLLYVIACEVFRRRKSKEYLEKYEKKIVSENLRFLWTNWYGRYSI